MSFTFTMPAGPGERFPANAFDNQIGRRTTVRVGDDTREAIILRATVAPDGQSAQITVDADLSEFEPRITPNAFGIASEPW